MNRPIRFLRPILAIAIAAAMAMPVPVFAQDDNGVGFGQPLPDIAPSECSAPQIVNSVQMIRLANRDADLVPITINGLARNFLLDTGSYATQIQRPAADELHLPIQPSNIEIYDLTGQIAREQAFVGQFAIGRFGGENVNFPVSPTIDSAQTSDGYFALNDMLAYDIDMDFGTDTLTFYSPNHCPGVVPFWAMAATAVLPITIQDNHILVPVTLDGRQFRAWIDTGATFTSLDIPDAQTQYGLTMGDAAAPEAGTLNNDPALKTYSHNFGKLTIGGITVTAPHVTLIPDAMAQSLEKGKRPLDSINANLNPPKSSDAVVSMEELRKLHLEKNQQPGSIAAASQPPPTPPDLIIGMDVLRKLHLYMALGENKIYLSRASETTDAAKALQASLQPQAALQARFRQIAIKAIGDMDRIIAQDPRNVPALNERCYMRAALKSDLDLAAADCDQAVRLRPKDAAILDSQAFLFYQQGKYRDALDVYNRVLALNPKSAPSLFMRGYTKGMLGDAAGRDADIQAATRAMPDVQRSFQQYNISY